MTRKTLCLIAAGGSAALLLGAFAFQYLGGMPPCKMCIWQRWPHGFAVVMGLLALWIPGRAIPMAGALAALTTAGIGAYHTGVERKWWEGPNSCTSGSVDGISADDLLNQIMNAPLVRCDEVPWEMFTLSMASWNAIVSFGLVFIWLAAVRAKS